MSTLADVEQAFRQLEFAVKLNCYCEVGHLDKNQFDTDVTVRIEEENIRFQEGAFQSYQDIIAASQINIGICFGVSAIVLDAALEDARIERNPGSRHLNDELRTIVYMIRCAFAHNFASPRWQVRERYAHEINLSIEGRQIPIDMRALHGQDFDYNHIGGLAVWYKIRDMAVQMIEEAQQRPI